jgi:hypothetical protein
VARKSKAVAKHKIPDIAASLKAKAATPMTVTVEDTLSQLAAPIQAMLDAGYSYDDVAEVFKSHGVDLAASSIQSYHRKHHKPTATIAVKSSDAAEEISTSTPTAVERNESGSPSSERSSEDSEQNDNDSSLNSEAPQNDLDANTSGNAVDRSSSTQAKSKGIKGSLPQTTQVNSKFNVTDRSKL